MLEVKNIGYNTDGKDILKIEPIKIKIQYYNAIELKSEDAFIRVLIVHRNEC